METKSFEPCVLALASICGNETFRSESIPQIQMLVEKMLLATNQSLPSRVVCSLIRYGIQQGIVHRFNTDALFHPGLRPCPTEYGITEQVLLPLYFDIESTLVETVEWSRKVDELKRVPQHAQRSPGWYKQREGAVTASDFATAVGESKYDKPNDLLLKKCGRGVPFTGNKFTRHGQRFEDAAVFLYEKMYKTKVIEFGLMPHGAIESHSRTRIGIVAASPDGITENGIMLEIKCPYTRQIVHYHPTTHGSTTGDNDIVPHGYYCQIQSQLECCDLEICDFMECNIKEFSTSQDFYKDVSPTCNYKTNNGKIKSCILEFKQNDLDNEDNVQLHVEYPPDIYIHNSNLQAWMKSTILRVQTDTLQFQRAIYYWIEDISIFRVYRDRAFFEERLPKIEAFWERVIEARETPEMLDAIDKKPKPRKQQHGRCAKDAVMQLCQEACLLGE